MKNTLLSLFAAWLVLGAMLLAQAPATPPSQPANETPTPIKQAQDLTSKGQHDEALAIYHKVLETSPNDLDAHIGIGIVLDLKGNSAEARKHLNKAIEVAPADKKERPWRTMAFSHAFECHTADAAKYEQMAFDSRMSKQDMPGAAGIANELARIYLECGDVENAAKWYKTGYETAQRKTDMKETDMSLWLFRWEHAQARIAARRGQKDEAQKHLAPAKAALDKANDPNQASNYPYLTGYVAFYTGDHKTAIDDLKRANQEDPFILSLLAQAYEKSGDRTQAMEYYRKVLANNGHGPTNAFARPLAKKKVGAS